MRLKAKPMRLKEYFVTEDLVHVGLQLQPHSTWFGFEKVFCKQSVFYPHILYTDTSSVSIQCLFFAGWYPWDLSLSWVTEFPTPSTPKNWFVWSFLEFSQKWIVSFKPNISGTHGTHVSMKITSRTHETLVSCSLCHMVHMFQRR